MSARLNPQGGEHVPCRLVLRGEGAAFCAGRDLAGWPHQRRRAGKQQGAGQGEAKNSGGHARRIAGDRRRRHDQC